MYPAACTLGETYILQPTLGKQTYPPDYAGETYIPIAYTLGETDPTTLEVCMCIYIYPFSPRGNVYIL